MTESSSNGQAKIAILVAGFNAHGQLCESHVEDIKSFQKTRESIVTRPESGTVLFAGWSSTIIQADSNEQRLSSLGHSRIKTVTSDSNAYLRCAIGDHNGMRGCLDDDGSLYVVDSESESLECRATETSPLIGHVAMTQNGRIAITFKQAPNGRLCHIVEFSSFDAFAEWYEDPSNEANHPEGHHMMPGRPRQLLGAATFMLLMDSGEVYTWGDARHRSLGRTIVGGACTPADQPGIMDALEGLKATKIASGGWIGAAISDGALYLWGDIPDGIAMAGDVGEIVLVHLPGPQTESLDVCDVAVGDDHIVVLAEGGRLFVVGDNTYGQLGLGGEQSKYSGWQEILHQDEAPVVGVAAGPKCTFAYVAVDTKRT